MEKVMFISSVGGHLTQLLELKDLFNEYDSVLVTEKTDVTEPLKNKYKTHYLIYGSRHYMLTYPFILIYNCFKSLFLFLRYRPNTIVTTGTHTAVPMCYIGWIFRKKIIYIESFAKRTIATKFIVQWESMLEHYPKAEFWGAIY